ncbi:MAG TPA: sigma-70 region 4 domain-containing protein [Gemmataceae bacterium]|nr:sigma-70 region 4 domain-containing protein [Gemmataceae bacterium]
MHRNQARLLAAVMGPAPQGGDVASLFDKEVSRLPAKDRAALVLCYVQGLSREEVARRLRRPPRSIGGRLARARRLLRARLARRGVRTSAAALRDFLASMRAGAEPVPTPLIDAAVRAGLGLADVLPEVVVPPAADS